MSMNQAAGVGPAPDAPDQSAHVVPAAAQPTVVASVTGEDFPPPPYGAALLPDDPPVIGGFWLDGRLAARASGIAFLAHDGESSSKGGIAPPVMLIVLSQGAAEDAAARDRLAGEVNKMHADTVLARGGADQDDGRLGYKFRGNPSEPIPSDDTPEAPWVALAYDGTVDAIAEADRVLRSVDLSSTPPIGAMRGPNFQLPWVTRTKPGNWRRWPLPWPRRTDRASWVAVLVSWLLMLVLAALALLIVVLLFQNPPPPNPNGGGGGSDSSASSSATSSGNDSPSGSGSPSQSGTQTASESGSPTSGSPTASGSDSGSQSASPSDSGSASGSPTDSPGGHDSPQQTASMISPTSGTASQGQPSINPDLWHH